jgi:uncharacterized membrane protein YhaH (DUF805 family)
MPENVQVQAATPRRGFSWLAGRAGRREYWVTVAFLLAISFALPAPPLFRAAFLAILVIAQVRRVHDFGRTGWWAAAATVAPLLCLPVLLVATEEDVLLMGAGLSLILMVAIGAIPGDRNPNRFGAPPPFTLRRVLTGR